jgi:hypothetical protein
MSSHSRTSICAQTEADAFCVRSRLKHTLARHCPANLVAVVLADQENLMQYLQDDHPHPNIDISYVKFTGREFQVPSGAEWGCANSSIDVP